MQVPKGRDQVSGGVSVPCRQPHPSQMFYGNHSKFGKRSSSVQSLIIIWGIIHVICYNVIIMGYHSNLQDICIYQWRSLAPKSGEGGGGKKERKKKVVLKVGSRVIWGSSPRFYFTETGAKIGNSRHF